MHAQRCRHSGNILSSSWLLTFPSLFIFLPAPQSQPQPDPSMDLSQVTISTPPAALAAVSDVPPGKYEATNNTLYVGGLPIEWTNEQVSCRCSRLAWSCGLWCSQRE